MSATIKNEKVEFRRKVSVHEEFDADKEKKKKYHNIIYLD